MPAYSAEFYFSIRVAPADWFRETFSQHRRTPQKSRATRTQCRLSSLVNGGLRGMRFEFEKARNFGAVVLRLCVWIILTRRTVRQGGGGRSSAGVLFGGVRTPTSLRRVALAIGREQCLPRAPPPRTSHLRTACVCVCTHSCTAENLRAECADSSFQLSVFFDHLARIRFSSIMSIIYYRY